MEKVVAQKRKRSVVGDIIKYDLVNDPKWQQKGEQIKSVPEMLLDIERFQTLWENEKENCSHNDVKKVLKDMEVQFLFHVNKEEGHGLGTFEETESVIRSRYKQLKRHLSKNEQEVLNLSDAFAYLKDVQREDARNMALLDAEILKEAHKRILKGVDMNGKTQAGSFSEGKRVTEYKGEFYEYGKNNGMEIEESVQLVLDRYNSLINACMENWNESKQKSLAEVFKTAAYLLFEMLDVHPFSDGNGRLCRLLVSYSLSFTTPFPSSVYNLWSPITDKDVYIDAIVAARKSKMRQPQDLASMIIECNWFAWKHFLTNLHFDVFTD